MIAADDAAVGTESVAADDVGINGINKANMVTIKNVVMVCFIIFSLKRPMERNDLNSIIAQKIYPLLFGNGHKEGVIMEF